MWTRPSREQDPDSLHRLVFVWDQYLRVGRDKWTLIVLLCQSITSRSMPPFPTGDMVNYGFLYSSSSFFWAESIDRFALCFFFCFFYISGNSTPHQSNRIDILSAVHLTSPDRSKLVYLISKSSLWLLPEQHWAQPNSQ